MSKVLPSGRGRLALQLCAAAGVAALLAGCSADSTRLADPFANPFATSSNEPVRHLARNNAIPAGRSPPVLAQALPSSSVVASAAPLRPNLTSRSYAAPISNETTGSIEPGPVRSARGPAYGGWTSSGGVPVVVGQGESVDVLSKRYGVPSTALLQTNGLTSGEFRPGTKIVIPVYNAVAAAEPVREPRPVAQAEPAPTPVAAKPSRLAKASLLKPASERIAAAEERKATAPAKVAPAKVVAKVERPVEKVAEAKPAHVRPIAKAEKPVETKNAKLAEEKSVKLAEEKARKEAKPAIVAAAPVAPAKSKVEKVAKAEKAEKAEKVERAAKLDKPASAKSVPVKTATAAPAPTVEAPVPAKPDPAPTTSVVPGNATVADASGAPEFRWPARGHIIQGFKGGNDGINIALPDGTPVKAAENGTVAYAGSELKGYGNLVLIRHPNGYVTAYANNGEIDVKRGDQVKRGQTIAKSGQSGNVSSPQLHFELRKGSTPVDPTSYLAGL